jgi:excisionase family DNA binding protein
VTMLQIYGTGPLKGSPLLTVDEVAQLLGVSAGWVYQHSCGARRPSLPSVKLGRAVRFRPESLEQFVRDMERSA